MASDHYSAAALSGIDTILSDKQQASRLESSASVAQTMQSSKFEVLSDSEEMDGNEIESEEESGDEEEGLESRQIKDRKLWTPIVKMG